MPVTPGQRRLADADVLDERPAPTPGAPAAAMAAADVGAAGRKVHVLDFYMPVRALGASVIGPDYGRTFH